MVRAVLRMPAMRDFLCDIHESTCIRCNKSEVRNSHPYDNSSWVGASTGYWDMDFEVKIYDETRSLTWPERVLPLGLLDILEAANHRVSFTRQGNAVSVVRLQA